MRITNCVVIFGLAVLLAVLIPNNGADGSIFRRTFEQLHREPPSPPILSRATVQTKWIDQKLNNFDEADTRKWQMRYKVNDEFFQPGGPLFIFVGGEWNITDDRLLGGHMYDMAKEHNGMLYYTEHRYYGESRPTSDMSADNMKYLHVRQALADLKYFIETMKSTNDGMADSKVILVGGSYSATMVTWFKKLYPDVATGCWASSAPLLAQLNFFAFKEITGQSIELVGGTNCYKRIEKAIAELEHMVDNRRRAEISAMFKLCSRFDYSNDLDVWTLFREISDIFALIVQIHDDGDIQGACKEIMTGDDDLIGFSKYLMKHFQSETCNDLSYKAIVTSLMDTTYNGNSMRQWIYQTCNEYGWYQTSDSSKQPFGTKFPPTLYTTMCKDSYGDDFTDTYIKSQIESTNALFGGLRPNVQNVYLTHGQLDPWRGMGIQNSLATIIPMHAHCKDLNSISSKDTSEMTASKERIAELVREWVADK